MITTFSVHYRRKYGLPVGKIPLDVGVECPNRQRGGCIFCRPAGFTPLFLNRNDAIGIQLAKGKKDLERRKFRFFLGYFQQETVTALPMEQLLPVMKQVMEEDGCVGLILSTRPDYIDSEIVATLDELCLSSGKEILVEIGLQSVHDKSLRLLNRNHTFNDYRRAAELIRLAPNLQLGVHLIFGIPGESPEEMLVS
ncbi:MAG: radical SAM protein, partial [Desulfobulbaceae bacterium]|nr:radical SAM protein [Desulfobulbaceae bacterium]